MFDFIWSYLSIVHFLVVITFLFATFGLSWKNQTHLYLIMILSVFLVNEIISVFCDFFLSTMKINFTITTFIHHLLWLLILRKSVAFPNLVNAMIIAFATFCLCNFFFIEGWLIFNCYSFIFGAFIYLVFFLIESFNQLNKENFPFFFSNQFILLMAPVLFFIGLSFMFGFKSKEVNTIVFFEKFQLYKTIVIVVNVVYYSLLNIYIYREKNKLYEF